MYNFTRNSIKKGKYGRFGKISIKDKRWRYDATSRHFKGAEF